MDFLLRVIARLLALAALCAASPAWALFGCSISAAPSPIVGIYAAGANRDIAGSFTVTCTRDPNADDRRPYIWIGIDQPVGGQSMPRDIGGSTLNYFVYRRNYGQGVWLNTGSQAQNSNTAGALRVRLDFGNRGAALTDTFNFYFRVPSGQGSAAGVYIDAPVAVTLRNDNQAGAVLGTTALNTRISIQHNCRFSISPAPVSVNYTAFQAAAPPITIPFELVCTQGTTYTMALDARTGVVPNVSLRYDIALSTTGSKTGSAQAQAYSAAISFPGGQAGRCTTGSCTGTSVRTITVTY